MSAVAHEYPNDTDGESLRGVAEAGADMSQPMNIDFSVQAPDEAAARSIAKLVEARGFDPSFSDNGGAGPWSVYCSKYMIATYAAVTEAQVQLNEIAAPFKGGCQGWVTFGN